MTASEFFFKPTSFSLDNPPATIPDQKTLHCEQCRNNDHIPNCLYQNLSTCKWNKNLKSYLAYNRVIDTSILTDSESVATKPISQNSSKNTDKIDFSSGFPKNFKLSKYDYRIAGLGEPEKNCGANRITHFKKDLTGLGYTPIHCKRVECPVCYKEWVKIRAFTIAVDILAYHELTGESPHAVTFSVDPEIVKEWDWEDFNEKLFRRGYKALKKMGAIGGWAFMHPFRIKKSIQKQLNERGLKPYWRAVREDALNLDSFYDYLSLSPHAHSVGFPSFLDQHESTSFFVKKYAVLDHVKDDNGVVVKDVYKAVVSHVRYLLSHSGIVRDEVKHSVRSWGFLSHTSKNAFDPETALGSDRYAILCQRVASMLGMFWSVEGGLAYDIDENKKEDWLPIWQLPQLYRRGDSGLDVCLFQYGGAFDTFWIKLIELVECRIASGDPLLVEDVIKLKPPDKIKLVAMHTSGGDDLDG